jgi:nitroreductase
MDFHDLIRARESIRDYDPKRPVQREVLDRILEAGRIAPSAANRQPWEFWIVESPTMLSRLRPCYTRPWFHDAPQILVVVGTYDKAWVRRFDGYNSIETDLSIALTHLILAAENEGVGTCWIEAYDPAILREALKLSDNQVVFGITPLGYPRPEFVKKGIKDRKPASELIRFL